MRMLGAAASVCGATLALSACATPWEPVGAIACPSWVHFETPADAAKDSAAVFVGTVLAQDGTAPHMEVDMSAWTVKVDEVVGGDAVTAGDTVRVVSMADPCTGTAVYDDGDPLDAVGDRLLIFVHAYEGEFWTPTPYQGVLPVPADGEIPARWPAG